MFHESSDGYGAIMWNIEDDMGGSHTIRLPNFLYIPEGGVRLLSPQHWAPNARDNNPNPRGTRCVTYADCIELEWNQRKFKRTVPLSINGSNVATIQSITGYSKFDAYESLLEPSMQCCMPAASSSGPANPNDIFCMPGIAFDPSVISDDAEDYNKVDADQVNADRLQYNKVDADRLQEPFSTIFSPDGPDGPHEIADEEDQLPQEFSVQSCL